MAQSDWKPPELPREHGAWVMLVLPLILGARLAGANASAAWLVPVAVILAFLAHCSLVPAVQKMRSGKPVEPAWFRHRLIWAGIYLTAAALAFAAVYDLTPEAGRSTLLAIAIPAGVGGAFYTVAAALGHGRRIPIELLGMVAMSLSAPIMAVAAGRAPDSNLSTASLAALGYSVSTLAYVRAYGNLKKGNKSAIGVCLLAHAGLFAVLAILTWRGLFSVWMFLAFVPPVVRTVLGLARPPQFLKQVGMREIWVAISFAVLAVLLLEIGI
jgi:hypothetical protein